MSELRVNFSVFKSDILYNKVTPTSSACDKDHYVDYMLHANPYDKNPKSPKLFIRGLRFAEDNSPSVDAIQNPADAPAKFVVNATSDMFWTHLEHSYVSNIPLKTINFPKGKALSDYMFFSFAEVVPGEEPFMLINSVQGDKCT